MPTPVMHAAADPNPAESVRPDDELPPILAVLPQIPGVEAIEPGLVETTDLTSGEAIDSVPAEVIERKAAEIIDPKPSELHDSRPTETIEARPAADLALDLVLNEIVLQARLTTNATGAVFGLARSGELICRATTGATASDVAICLNAKSGIAATCFATGAVRRVDDLGPDPNADAVAYRRSGVRSILVVPVQGEKGPLLGILEIFSPRPNAFCDRDVLTLQALARRIAANIELIQESFNQQGYSVATSEPRAFAASDRTSLNTAKAKRTPRELHIPPFLRRMVAQRARLASVDWISTLAKTAIALVLIAGSMSARSCWQRGGDAKFIQLIAEPLSHTLRSAPATTAVKQQENTVSTPEPAAPQHLGLDPAAWPSIRSAHSEISPSITIQRVPVHTSKTEQAAAERRATQPRTSPDVVLFDNHQTVSKRSIAEQSKLSSKDPA
ncbi:MAG: GAF domain-containing protein, partial [Terriglobales bacterium]